MTTASATRHTGGLIVDRDPVISYHRTVLSTMMVAALLILALFGIKDLLLGRYLAAGILAAMSVASIAAWARGRREEDPRQVVRITRILGRGYAALLACYLAHALLVAVEFSRLPWMYVFPVLLFFTLPVREGVLWILAFASVVVVAVARAGDGVDIAPELLVRFAFSFALRTALLAGVGTMFATNSARLEQALGRLRSDSDRLQHDVAASEERFRLLFEYAPDPIYLYTLDGTFVDGNRAAERLVGYRREELIGQGLIKMGLVPVSQAPRLTAGLLRRGVGRPTGPEDFRLRPKQGDDVDVEVSTYPIRLDGQRVVLGIARDVTRRREWERQMAAARERAEAGSRAKSAFLATMSHELRTPLNHVIGFTELLAGRQLGELNDTQAEYLDEVLSSSRHLLALINDILDLSKIEAGKLELQRERVGLGSAVDTAIVVVSERARRRSVSLSTDLELAPRTVRADARKLKQALVNLLANAVKFSREGGGVMVRASIRTVEDGQVQSADGRTFPVEGRDVVEIRVRDRGIGIATGDLERVFEPFEQADRDTSRRYEGTGLGLSLTREIVELHGGRIWAESAGRDRGATFVVVLPLDENEPLDQGQVQST